MSISFKKPAFYLWFICLIIVVGGCATPMPPLEFTPRDVNVSIKKLDADLRTITISVAQNDEKFGETMVGFGGNEYEQTFKSAFQSALEEGLARSAIFNDLSNRKVSLSAKILEFQTPSFSSSFETEMIVRYQLIERSTGAIVYSKNISSKGSVPYNYAFVGAVRFTEARNISVRNNVLNLISDLEKSDITVPLTLEEIKASELVGKPIPQRAINPHLRK
jgi:hypothetical protein